MQEFIWHKIAPCLKDINPSELDKPIYDVLSNFSYNLDIPILSQNEQSLVSLWLNPEKAKYWNKRSCWIMCVSMALSYFLEENAYDLNSMDSDRNLDYSFFDFDLWKEKSYKYFEESYWWLHYWLLNLVRKYWLYWSYRNISSDKCHFMINLEKLLSKNCVVWCSVNFFWDINKSENSTSWHLVIVKWFNLKTNKLYVNDPYNTTSIEVDIDEFLKKFNWNIFMISDTPHEDFLVKTPFTLDITKSDICKINVMWIHQNEHKALSIIKQHAWLTWAHSNSIILNQNWERYIRYQAWNQYVRIDPNRIFDDLWLKLNISVLNKHLSEDNKLEAFRKWINVRNYILSNIDLSLPTVAIHNNIAMNVNNFRKRFSNVHYNPDIPTTCFVIVTMKEDYDALVSCWNFNVVLWDDYDNDGGFADYCLKNWLRYFNIETSFDQPQIQEFYFVYIKKLLWIE